MLFNTPEYIFFFLPAVFIVYFILTKCCVITLSKLWLIGASFYFYSFGSTQHLFLLFASLMINYLIGQVLQNNFSKANVTSNNYTQKYIFLGGLTANIIFLSIFKYSDFAILNLNKMSDTSFSYLGLALPLAISFYTFQQISYLVDSYRLTIKANSFLNYALYVMFFPQLIAGPILRYQEISPQLDQENNWKINLSNV